MPNDTKKVGQVSFVVNYFGNGNKCNLVVVGLFSTSLGYGSVFSLYRDKALESPGQSAAADIAIGYYQDGKLVFSAPYVEKRHIDDLSHKLPHRRCPPEKLCYVLLADDISNYGYDIRCQ